jgi:DNA polymerase elongation subunit (family B)
MALHYLINAETFQEGMKLIFFNPSTRELKEIVDTDYRPYFFIPHPMSPKDRKIIDALNVETRIEEKKELFTNQIIKVTRIEIDNLSDLKKVSERFEKSWEEKVPFVLSYIYDRGLNFGAQHLIQNERVKPLFYVQKETRERFEERFWEVKIQNPEKFELLEKWFTLCSQPFPEVPHEILGVKGDMNPERYHLAFILSRVANLPVPQTYTSRQVSIWIRSILHSHLRKNNFLIPRSRELRKGETKKSVQGALTFQPKPGIYFNTVVTDFESLYPSLIDAYNLSYETINCPHIECRNNKVPGLEHYVCTLRRGVYSVLIGALKDLRIHWYKPLARIQTLSIKERHHAQATSQLLKLILVSSYGVTIRIHGLSRPSLAESITAYGRHSLQTTWNIAKKAELRPIYGDTDSLFLDDPREEQIAWLIKTVKARLNLDLAVDERYSVCVLPRAMKAYFGIRKDGTSDIKGVTAIKSNSPQLIQKVFKDSVKEMAEVKNQDDFEEAKERIQRIMKNTIHALKAGNVNLKDLEYQIELHDDPMKKMKEKAWHQPYQCAIQLIDSGKPIYKGDIVRFIKVKPFSYRKRTFTVKPIEQVQKISEVNVEDYVRNLRTALSQTFQPMGLQFLEEWEKKITLSDFL